MVLSLASSYREGGDTFTNFKASKKETICKNKIKNME